MTKPHSQHKPPLSVPEKHGTSGDPNEAPDRGDEASQQAFLWHTHEYLANYARFADTKAAFAGALGGALLGSLYSAKAFAPLVAVRWYGWSVGNWSALIAGVILSLSITFAIMVVYPRLRSSNEKGFIFWGDIASHSSISELRSGFAAQSIKALNDQLLSQNYIVSRYVCIPKYRNVSWCLILLVLGAVFAGGALLLTKSTSLTAPPPTPVQQQQTPDS